MVDPRWVVVVEREKWCACPSWAAPTLEEALELSAFDGGERFDVFLVPAPDAGAARVNPGAGSLLGSGVAGEPLTALEARWALVAARQPVWELVANLGDAAPLDHGGLFVYRDASGVYPPEMERCEQVTEEDGSPLELRRVCLERCTYTVEGVPAPFESPVGVLSDNRFHPGLAAWFAGDLGAVASYVGAPVAELRAGFCSDDPVTRAEAYRAVLDYHGWENGDSYPRVITRAEAEVRYGDEA